MCRHSVGSGGIQPSWPGEQWQSRSFEAHAQSVSFHGDTAVNDDTAGSAVGQVCFQLLSLDGENPPQVPRRCGVVLAGTQISAGNKEKKLFRLSSTLLYYVVHLIKTVRQYNEVI